MPTTRSGLGAFLECRDADVACDASTAGSRVEEETVDARRTDRGGRRGVGEELGTEAPDGSFEDDLGLGELLEPDRSLGPAEAARLRLRRTGPRRGRSGVTASLMVTIPAWSMSGEAAGLSRSRPQMLAASANGLRLAAATAAWGSATPRTTTTGPKAPARASSGSGRVGEEDGGRIEVPGPVERLAAGEDDAPRHRSRPGSSRGTARGPRPRSSARRRRRAMPGRRLAALGRPAARASAHGAGSPTT